MEQADWDELKAQMESPYGSMKLKCDNFEVGLVQTISHGKKTWGTLVYIDGYLKGIWLSCDNRTGEPKHEETRRFLRKVTRSVRSKKEIEAYRKVFGKRKASEMEATKFFTYDWEWRSFPALKKHLITNNKDISRLH